MSRCSMIATIRGSYVNIEGYRLIDLDTYEIEDINKVELQERLERNEMEVNNLMLTIHGVEETSRNINIYSILDSKSGELRGYSIKSIIDKRDHKYLVSDVYGKMEWMDKEDILDINDTDGIANIKMLKETSVMKIKDIYNSGIIKEVVIDNHIKFKRLNNRYIRFTDSWYAYKCSIESSWYAFIGDKIRNIVILHTCSNKLVVVCKGYPVREYTDYKILYTDKERTYIGIDEIYSMLDKEYKERYKLSLVLTSENDSKIHLFIIDSKDKLGNVINIEIPKINEKVSLIEAYKSSVDSILDTDLEVLKKISKELGMLDIEVIRQPMEIDIEDVEREKLNIDTDKSIKSAYKLKVKQINKIFKKEVYGLNTSVQFNKVYTNVPVIDLKSYSVVIEKYIIKIPELSHLVITQDKGKLKVGDSNTKADSIKKLGLNMYAQNNNIMLDVKNRINNKELRASALKYTETNEEVRCIVRDMRDIYEIVFDKREIIKACDNIDEGLLRTESKLNLISNDRLTCSGYLEIENGIKDRLILNDACPALKVSGLTGRSNRENFGCKVDILDRLIYESSLMYGIKTYIKNLVLRTKKAKINNSNGRDYLLCDNMLIEKESLNCINRICKKGVLIKKLRINCNVRDIKTDTLIKIIESPNIIDVEFDDKVDVSSIQEVKDILDDVHSRLGDTSWRDEKYHLEVSGREDAESLWLNRGNYRSSSDILRYKLKRYKIGCLTDDEQLSKDLKFGFYSEMIFYFLQYVTVSKYNLINRTKDSFKIDYEEDWMHIHIEIPATNGEYTLKVVDNKIERED